MVYTGYVGGHCTKEKNHRLEWQGTMLLKRRQLALEIENPLGIGVCFYSDSVEPHTQIGLDLEWFQV